MGACSQPGAQAAKTEPEERVAGRTSPTGPPPTAFSGRFDAPAKMSVTSGDRQRSDFAPGSFLGNGSFCHVISCTDSKTGTTFAQKVVRLKTQGAPESCKMEAHCLRRLADSGVVPLLRHVFETSLEWVAVLDLCEGGELWNAVRGTGSVDPLEQVWYAAQMVEAVAVVHAAGIVHRDLKCENFLIVSQACKRLKLIDFGTARDMQHPEVQPAMTVGKAEHHVGTPNFMSPEAIDNKANDFASDIWSLGCSILQLLLGVPPFVGPGPYFVLDRAQRCDLWFPSALDPQARSLIEALVRQNPTDRLGAAVGVKEILCHPYFDRRPSTVPDVSAECLALRSIGRALQAMLGPLEQGQGMLLDGPPDEAQIAAERKSIAKKAWQEARNEIDAFAAGRSDSAVSALRTFADRASENIGEEFDTIPEVDGMTAFSAAQLARFVEQAKRLRQDIENPTMPSYDSEDGDDEDEDDEEEENE